MTLIKCSHCGHTVLSVASHCPACSRPLGQTFLPLDHEGALAQCRSCGHQVRTRTRVCPNCGAADPARWPRAARSALAAAAGVAAVGVLAMLVTGNGLPGRAASSVAARQTPPTAAARTGAARTGAAPAEAARPEAAAPVHHPAPTAADSTPHISADPAKAPAPAPTASPAAATPTTALQTRWTTTWVNVRGAPSNEAPVLRVLGPGTPVQGTAGRWGWWAVRLGSDSVGYIAGDLLSDQKPGD